MRTDRASREGQESAFALVGWRARRAAGPPRQQRARLFWPLRTGIFGFFLILGLALLVQQVVAVSQQPNDFCQDYIAAQRLAHGVPIYLPLSTWVHYGDCPIHTVLDYDAHPPPSAFLFLPLGLLPKVPAAVIWGCISLAAYVIAGMLLLRELGWCSLPGLALFVLGSALWTPFLLSEQVQNYGNLLLLLLVLSWVLERRRRDGWSGALIGVAGLLKVWPAALLFSAAFRRRWRFTLVGGLVLALGTALTLAVLGVGAYLTYLGPVGTSEHDSVPDKANISLVGLLVRFLNGSPNHPLPLLAAPGLNLTELVLLAECLAILLYVGAFGFLLWCQRGRPSEAGELLGYGFFLTLLMLLFPLTWLWGVVTLLLPLTTTLLALRQMPRPPLWWFVLLCAGLAPLLLPGWIVGFPGWLPQHPSASLSGWEEVMAGLPTYGLVLFAAAQAWLLWQVRAPAAARLMPSLETAAPEGRTG